MKHCWNVILYRTFKIMRGGIPLQICVGGGIKSRGKNCLEENITVCFLISIFRFSCHTADMIRAIYRLGAEVYQQ